MKKAVCEREDGLEQVRQYEIMPLMAGLFPCPRGLRECYGLEILGRTVTPEP